MFKVPCYHDPRSYAARVWSNTELMRICKELSGSVVNVSAWKDSDKQGDYYRNYFINATEYWMTNWKSDARGFQGDNENEIYLDLEKELPEALSNRFDVVFNHTTLEHVFEVFKAFECLCSMSKDCVIVVVPFMQEQHGEYGDYWRFTPLSLKRLFDKYGYELSYISYNDGPRDAIYVVAAASINKETADKLKTICGNKLSEISNKFIGQKIIKQYPLPLRYFNKVLRMLEHALRRK